MRFPVLKKGEAWDTLQAGGNEERGQELSWPQNWRARGPCAQGDPQKAGTWG